MNKQVDDVKKTNDIFLNLLIGLSTDPWGPGGAFKEVSSLFLRSTHTNRSIVFKIVFFHARANGARVFFNKHVGCRLCRYIFIYGKVLI